MKFNPIIGALTSLTKLNQFPMPYRFYLYPFITKHLFDLKNKKIEKDFE